MIRKMKTIVNSNGGMELVQVAVLVAIAIVVGLIFKNQIMTFVTNVFNSLSDANFPK
jgi:amino acid transporter